MFNSKYPEMTNNKTNFKQIVHQDLEENLKNIKRDLKFVDSEIDALKLRIKDTEMDVDQIVQELSFHYGKPPDQRDYKKINALHNKKMVFNDQMIKYRETQEKYLSLKRQYRTQEEKLATHIQKLAYELEKNSDITISNTEIIEAFKVIGRIMVTNMKDNNNIDEIPEASVLLEARKELEIDPIYQLD